MCDSSISNDFRFWSYIELHGILLISWPIELITYFSRETYDSLIVGDCIKCFSSVLIFVIFVLRKNVKSLLLRKYDTLREAVQ